MSYFKDEKERTLFIIGGGEIYRMAIESNIVDEMYITHVHHSYEAETFFPEFDAAQWKSSLLFQQEIDEKHEAAFTVRKYTKVG
jgi:dihydrofolate reductase